MTLPSSLNVMVLTLCTTGVLCLGLAYIVGIRRRDAPGTLSFALLLVAAGEWAFCVAGERLSPDPAAKISWAKFEYFGIMSVAPLWFTFALHYTHQDRWLTRRHRLLLWTIPVLTVGLAMTNEWHRLIWTAIYPTTSVPGSSLTYVHGIAFWIAATFNYVLLVAGSIALIWAIYRFPQVYRRQAAALLTGIAVPWMANALYLANLSPLGHMDPTPVACVLTGAVYAWTIFRWQLFSLMPIARDALVEQMADGVILLDAQNRIVDMNPCARAMLGIAADPVGQSAEALFGKWPELLKQLVDKQSAPMTLELDLSPQHNVEIRISALQGPLEQFGGRLIVLRDVSERRRLDRMRDDLTHTVVHDLRNPLNVVIGVLEALQENAPSDAQVLELTQIGNESVGRMLLLVNSILDVNQIENGTLVLVRSETRLETLVAEAVRWQNPLAKRKQIDLVNQVGEGLPSIFVDARLLGRVLQNLIDNAIKFTPSGGKIQIHAEHEVDTKQLAVSVSDTGPGIGPEFSGKLFDKYSSANVPERGSGLGLAFCRLVVEAHGGTIQAENRAGWGATLTFRLPLGKGDVTTRFIPENVSGPLPV